MSEGIVEQVALKQRRAVNRRMSGDATCSHGKPWEVECLHCDLLWYRQCLWTAQQQAHRYRDRVLEIEFLLDREECE